MEIRNGFIKVEDGEWLNLNIINLFTIRKGVDNTYAIYAYCSKMGVSVRVTKFFENKELAQRVLDNWIQLEWNA